MQLLHVPSAGFAFGIKTDRRRSYSIAGQDKVPVDELVKKENNRARFCADLFYWATWATRAVR
jgi:hypothetical protein